MEGAVSVTARYTAPCSLPPIQAQQTADEPKPVAQYMRSPLQSTRERALGPLIGKGEISTRSNGVRERDVSWVAVT